MPPSGRSGGHSSGGHHSSSSSHRSSGSSFRSSSSRSSGSSFGSSRSSGPSSRPSSFSGRSRSTGLGSLFGSGKSSGPSRPSGTAGSARPVGSSGPSGHSSSSYNGTFNGGVRPAKTVKPRARVNQPSGYNSMIPGLILRELLANRHDYTYYPESWTNSEGKHFDAGYYDENGNYYKNVAIEDEETTFTCEYCGTMKKVVWKEGTAPICDRCLAPLHPDIVDKKQEEQPEPVQQTPSFNTETNEKKKKTSFIAILIMIIVLFVFISIISSFIRSIANSTLNSLSNSGTSSGITQTSDYTPANSIYVEEIGRTCYLDEDGFYTDPDTECWFYYDDEDDGWYYWFEGISSDYGDYGWMVFDDNEGRWYIENGYNDWRTLPSSYDTSKLWHIGGTAQSTTSNNDLSLVQEDSIYVEEIGRTCYLDEDGYYYDEETECWFYQDEEYGVWVYWFEGISSDYGDYGYMVYNTEDNKWYIQTGEENWEVLPSKYDQSGLWHIK